MILDPKIKAILFDFYQTLVEIKTDETKDELWQVLASFLEYRGADVGPDELRELYHREMRERLEGSLERHPEIEVEPIFGKLLSHLGVGSAEVLAAPLAQLLRVLSIEQFQLYPESRDVLWRLANQYRLALVSDSQKLYLEARAAQDESGPLLRDHGELLGTGVSQARPSHVREGASSG